MSNSSRVRTPYEDLSKPVLQLDRRSQASVQKIRAYTCNTCKYVQIRHNIRTAYVHIRTSFLRKYVQHTADRMCTYCKYVQVYACILHVYVYVCKMYVYASMGKYVHVCKKFLNHTVYARICMYI